MVEAGTWSGKAVGLNDACVSGECEVGLGFSTGMERTSGEVMVPGRFRHSVGARVDSELNDSLVSATPHSPQTC
jgi:hypothetical protein